MTTQIPAADQSSGQTPPHGYTLWAVLRRDPHNAATTTSPDAVAELETTLAAVQADGAVTVRGLYDVSGFKADADLMIWLHGPRAEELQAALRELRRTEMLRTLLPTWNTMGMHRDAEFNARHVPAFLRGVEPAEWITVYPFVRTHQWYLLPEDERRTMLADHGRQGAKFTGVLTNTVAAFALGDYEWILPLEAENLDDLVDLMRDLRYTEARRYVHLETPFYTGRRIDAAALAEVLA